MSRGDNPNQSVDGFSIYIDEGLGEDQFYKELDTLLTGYFEETLEDFQGCKISYTFSDGDTFINLFKTWLSSLNNNETEGYSITVMEENTDDPVNRLLDRVLKTINRSESNRDHYNERTYAIVNELIKTLKLTHPFSLSLRFNYKPIKGGIPNNYKNILNGLITTITDYLKKYSPNYSLNDSLVIIFHKLPEPVTEDSSRMCVEYKSLLISRKNDLVY